VAICQAGARESNSVRQFSTLSRERTKTPNILEKRSGHLGRWELQNDCNNGRRGSELESNGRRSPRNRPQFTQERRPQVKAITAAKRPRTAAESAAGEKGANGRTCARAAGNGRRSAARPQFTHGRRSQHVQERKKAPTIKRRGLNCVRLY